MENILVAIRVRPLNKQEAAKGSPWKLTPTTISLSSAVPTPARTYSFDRVFGPDTKTADIYDPYIKKIVSSAVEGFNGTVLAYGQTSSGKTFTMGGSTEEPGIIHRAIQDVFRNIEAARDRDFVLKVSYIEIYNEEIRDLLAPENCELQIHENIERGIFVAGLREEIVVGAEQVLELLKCGEAQRHVGETNLNDHSSRSHAIFRVAIESRDISQNGLSDREPLQINDLVRVSHLNLIDLAGSDRVSKTGAVGTRLKEGTHINKSLMTLGNVVNKLSEGIEKHRAHVPYRDSKLTRILQPSLGGNARTVIICNITPALVHVEETRGSLHFASGANRVTNYAQVIEVATGAAMLEHQTKEIVELRKKRLKRQNNRRERRCSTPQFGLPLEPILNIPRTDVSNTASTDRSIQLYREESFGFPLSFERPGGDESSKMSTRRTSFSLNDGFEAGFEEEYDVGDGFSLPEPSPQSSCPGRKRRSSDPGRYVLVSRSRDASFEEMSIDNAGDMRLSSEFNYTVHIPPTPDHQPMSKSNASRVVAPPPAVAGKIEQQFVSSTMFTGGYNAVTRGHVMEKVTENDELSHPQLVGSRGLSCQMDGCDAKAMRDERGEDINPCECNFKICRDCYLDILAARGKCPGCKDEYADADFSDDDDDDDCHGHHNLIDRKALPSPTNESKMERTLSVINTSKRQLLINQQHQTGGDSFDHARWLYETKGTYGYGNALWPKDVGGDGGGGRGPGMVGAAPPSFNSKSRRPLSRKLRIAPGVISPYRFLALMRFLVLGFFLAWRIQNPNRDAMWLWGMSVVCELWFAFSWILDQLPKLFPVNRQTDLQVLTDMFERVTPENPRGRSDLPGIDVFVSTADPEKEPPLVTANTVLSILAGEYPVEKLSCYLSDDGGALLTFEAIAEASSFASVWVPFCRKHNIEPRNPETYFMLRGDPTKGKVRQDFVKDRRRVKREYDEFKVRINGLPDSIRRRSDAYNAHEEIRAKRTQMESGVDPSEALKVPKATWMADGTHWPGMWVNAGKEHSRTDHAGIIQVMLAPPSAESLMGSASEENLIDTTDIDVRLPMLVYVSREKRPGYDHNKKAGAMNALVRTSAIMSNGSFILNLDCDHYIYNSLAMREAMCFMMGRGGDRICYVQFPQRFEGVDPSDRYANRNTVFFDVNMRALDGLQGPVYVGTGCVFRRTALYGGDPPRDPKEYSCWASCCGGLREEKKKKTKKKSSKVRSDIDVEISTLNGTAGSDDIHDTDAESQGLLPTQYGNSLSFTASIPVAEFQGRPLSGQGVHNGRPAGALTAPREPLDAATVAEAINVISCFYEDKTEWGQRVGWIYGSVTEDVVTGFRMHNRGWRSVYCVTKRDAFRGTVPINLTDRLHQVLRWATGSVEIFFSKNNAIFANTRMKVLQRVAYLNVGVYPFTSIFLLVYCFLPALSLFSGEFIVNSLNITFLVYLLVISVTLCLLAILEVKWAGITLEEWWRNEQFWVIGGTSAHLAAVLQGLLKVIAGVDISFKLTSKAGGEDEDDLYADLYVVKWTALMIPPITVMLVNLIAIAVAVSRTLYSTVPQWSKLVGGVFFSVWVLAHLYPFAKGLMGRRGRTPTIVFVWSGLLSIIISLLWVTISPPSESTGLGNANFQFP